MVDGMIYLILLDTPLHDHVIRILEKQLMNDLESDHPSLLAKWLPSNNTSSIITRNHAKTIMKAFNWNAKQYRQTLSLLRKRIDVLEVKMSSQNWGDINYASVPSNAMSIYSRAFCSNDEKRFYRIY